MNKRAFLNFPRRTDKNAKLSKFREGGGPKSAAIHISATYAQSNQNKKASSYKSMTCERELWYDTLTEILRTEVTLPIQGCRALSAPHRGELFRSLGTIPALKFENKAALRVEWPFSEQVSEFQGVVGATPGVALTT